MEVTEEALSPRRPGKWMKLVRIFNDYLHRTSTTRWIGATGWRMNYYDLKMIHRWLILQVHYHY